MSRFMSARRLSLLDTKTPARLAAFVDRVLEPVALQSPDERIASAIEEIKEAYRDKWPDAAIYIRDIDSGHGGMVIIMTDVRNQPARSIVHERLGDGWHSRGGEVRQNPCEGRPL